MPFHNALFSWFLCLMQRHFKMQIFNTCSSILVRVMHTRLQGRLQANILWQVKRNMKIKELRCFSFCSGFTPLRKVEVFNIPHLLSFLMLEDLLFERTSQLLFAFWRRKPFLQELGAYLTNISRGITDKSIKM